jgi:hypothetical protein
MRRRMFWGAVSGLVALNLATTVLWAQPAEGDPAAGRGARLAREPGERGQRPAVEAERLQAQIRELLAKAESLEAEGQLEEAKALREKAASLKVQLQELLAGRRGRAAGAELPARPGPEAVARLRKQADKLEAQGKPDAAAKLREQANQLEKFTQAAQENAQKERELRQQMTQLSAQARELREQGKEDAATEVTKKAQGVEEQLRALVKQREEARQGLAQNVEHRLQQLKEQAGKLEASGNVEEARRLREQADRWEKRLQEAPPGPAGALEGGRAEGAPQGPREGRLGRPLPPEGERPRAAARPEGAVPGVPQPGEGLPAQLRGMQEELKKLRAEIAALREEVQRLRETK